MRDEWQDITTAPSDGTEILICGGDCQYSEGYGDPEQFTGVTIARWYRSEWDGGYGSEYDARWIHWPTHWMPLPKPPTGTSFTVGNDASGEAE